MSRYIIIGILCVTVLLCGCFTPMESSITEINKEYEVRSVQLHYTGGAWYSIHYVNESGVIKMITLNTELPPLEDPLNAYNSIPYANRGTVYHTDGNAKVVIVRRIQARHPGQPVADYYDLELYLPNDSEIKVGDDQYQEGRHTVTATGRTIYNTGA